MCPPQLLKKIKEKVGVKVFDSWNFKTLWGGITNITMAKENPFMVINTYPIEQSSMQYGKDEVNLPDRASYEIPRKI